MKTVIQLHQVEVTSRCNLACRYCPHEKMTRPQVDMTPEIFSRAIEWIWQYPADEVNLSGIGEPLLNPSIVQFVQTIRQEFPAVRIIIPSNGLLLDDALAGQLAPYQPILGVSMHQPLKAAKAIEVARRHGIFGGANLDAVTTPNNWARQVDWYEPLYRFPCPWMRTPRAFIAANGDILRCCLDTTGASKIGSVLDEVHALETEPWELCKSCYQDP